MAGADQPFFMPFIWPFGNLMYMFSSAKDAKPVKPQAAGTLGIFDHLTAVVASWRSAAMGIACVYLVKDYPAFGAAKEWSFDWMWPILARNVISAWAICGFWDWLLYFSPLKQRLQKFKYNQRYPKFSRFVHDAFWTTTAVIFAAGIEIGMCHLWATGQVAFQQDMWETPVQNFLWLSLITHWRIPHFWFIHRIMHPWKTKTIPDIGQFLYNTIHSLHHKAYNPTAFSGTNMHPVESTLYFTAALIPCLFGCHPVIFTSCIADLAVGAWLGHDGFQWPGSGDYFHQLHHAHFDCNYGAPHVPIDYWLGTFAGSKAEVAQIWSDKRQARTN